jgi:hypothetical protein
MTSANHGGTEVTEEYQAVLRDPRASVVESFTKATLTGT